MKTETLTTENQLTPCPFCRGKANPATVRYSAKMIKEQEWDQDLFHFVTCEACGVSNCGLVGHRTPAKAAEHWNTRATERTPIPYGPVEQHFSKEQLVERAKEFMRTHFGNVKQMPPVDQRAYHETAGILMFYVDHVWKPFS